MSNAELIAEALSEYGTDREHMLERMDEDYHVARLIYALEEAEALMDQVAGIALGIDYANDHARVQALVLLFGDED